MVARAHAGVEDPVAQRKDPIRIAGAHLGSAAAGHTARAMPVTSRAIKIVGRLSTTSARRMMIVSTQPPEYPASTPSRTPRVAEISTAMVPIITDTRRPYRMTESRSRPWLSVPIG